MYEEDHDRPLNTRGHRDAPLMAEKLQARGMIPELLVSSSANRALSTAKYFAGTYAIDEKEILIIPKLYHAWIPVFYEVIAALPDQVSSAAIFSHNPGITAFVNELTEVRIDNMPTCGIFAVRFETNHWKDFEKSEKKFLFFDYPKL